MAPWLMLLAQVFAKKQQEQAARKANVDSIRERNVARMGGDTGGFDQLRFDRALAEQQYAKPMELIQMYDSFKSKDPQLQNMRGAELEPNRSAYTLMGSPDTELSQPRSFQQFDPISDDPNQIDPNPLYARKLGLTRPW